MRLTVSMVWLAAWSLSLAASGCGRPRGPTAELDAGAHTDAGSPRDAEALDATAPIDAGPSLDPISVVASLPATPDDVLWRGPGATVDLATAMHEASDGKIRVVFDSADAAFEEIHLYEVVGSRAGFGPARRLAPAVAQPFHASPSLVGDALIFEAATGLFERPVLYAWEGDTIAPLPAVAGIEWMLSWPQVASGPSGVALAFRDGASAVWLATGPHVEALGPPARVADERGAIPAVGFFGDGSMAFSYQHPVGAEPMVSFVVRSDDGTSFSTPVRVSESSVNVHDTALAARADGGLDLYYIFPLPPRGFVLHRRALAVDGRLGAEERLTSAEVGEPSKPSAARLSTGEVLVAFSDIAERDPATGEPLVQRLGLMLLASEAPPPP